MEFLLRKYRSGFDAVKQLFSIHLMVDRAKVKVNNSGYLLWPVSNIFIFEYLLNSVLKSCEIFLLTFTYFNLKQLRF